MKSGILDTTLQFIKKLIPKSVFDFFAPAYHTTLAYIGAVIYGFPSRRMKVIGVTGTKGKSTVTYLVTKILEGAGEPVAMLGSLGYQIRDKSWPNTLKMTMPGRFKIHKFMKQAADAGCKYLVLEVTSEGIKQKRHLGIKFDCAVYTNLHKEHIESHGSFENYFKAKQELFRNTSGIHVINVDDPHFELFSKFPAKHTIFYGIERLADMRASNIELNEGNSSFDIYGNKFRINLTGKFNIYNCLAALATTAMYGVDLEKSKPALEMVKGVPGRMEFVIDKPYRAVVDYAHTPDSLEQVYKALKKDGSKLICVLGACGGGRDMWKRPEFGRIADNHCDRIFLTNEDPYDEDPDSILNQIEQGISQKSLESKVVRTLDRKEAIGKAIHSAGQGDTVIITGKGSEVSMALPGGKKIPWSDRDIVIAQSRK